MIGPQPIAAAPLSRPSGPVGAEQAGARQEPEKGAPELRGRKIIVAMSGGVDSSVAAALLKEQGGKVEGVFMRLAQPDFMAQAAVAQAVADRLGIKLTMLDLREAFEREVLGYFSASYAGGATPNPCVVCNWKIKGEKLLEHAAALQADFLATGHYARIIRESAGACRLFAGADSRKDQSYFLCWLRQEQLRRLVMPLGLYTKEAARRLAEDYGLAGRHGKESQDVCFLQGLRVGDFLAARSQPPPVPGTIVTGAGVAVGQHEGLCRYTIGQRRGLGIPDLTPYYVTGFDLARNLLVVGKEADLYRRDFEVGAVNWVQGRIPALPKTLQVKIRYRHRAASAEVFPGPAGRVRVRFFEPQRAVTPGQFAVFYEGPELLGGGEIAVADRP